MKLDLRGFKHVGSDDKSTTLEHKNGHQVKVVHNVLSKSAQAQLKALGVSAKNSATKNQKEEKENDEKYGKVLTPKGEKAVPYADGGVVQYLDDLADRISGDKPQPKKPSQTGPKDKGYHLYENYAEGGDVTKFDPLEYKTELNPEGIKDVSAPAPKDTYQQKFEELKQTFPNQPDEVIARTAARDVREEQGAQQNISKEAANYKAEQDAIAQREAESKQRSEQAVLNAEKSIGVEQPQLANPNMQLPQEAALQGQPAAQGLGTQPAPAAQPSQSGDLMQDYMKNMTSGLDTQIQGIKQQAAAEGALGKEQAAIYQKQQEMTQNIISKFDTKQAELENMLKQHEQDIKDGYIDPNKYWTGYTLPNGQKVEGHSKIAATIGMLIAGFGGNDAVKMLQDQIDKSVDAQKQNLQSSNNLLRANLDHFKNVNEAMQMTKAMMIDAAQAQLNQAAANARSPLARAAALQAEGPLRQQKAQIMFNATLNKTINELTDENPSDTSKAEHTVGMLRQINMPDKAKELSERIVPGVGVATIPVPQKTRDELLEHQELAKDAQYLKDFIKNKSSLKGYNPADPDVIKAQQMVLSLQSKIREGKLGTVYKEGEQPLLDKFVKENPLTILGKIQSMPALDELLRSNETGMSLLKKSVGIKAPSPAAQVEPVERLDKATGKIALFDPTTKKFLGYKK